MKVLIVVSSLNTGGAQRAAANLSLGLRKSCDVDFLLNETTNIIFPHYGNILGLGFKYEPDKGNIFYQIRVSIRRFIVLGRLKRKGQYDAVFSFLDSANIVNILTGNKHSKTIITIHSVLSSCAVEKKYRYIVIPLVKLLYRYADNIVCVSAGVKEDLEKRIGVKNTNIVVIYNGFDCDDIIKKGDSHLISKEDNRLFEDHIVITAMGRLNVYKGFPYLIRALVKVREAIPNVRLIIIGEGEDRESLQKLIDTLNLQDCAFLIGVRDNPFCIIKRSKLFVLSSVNEALPSALIESLLLSVPCVSTNLKGAREILDPNRDKVSNIDSGLIIAKHGILTPVTDCGKDYELKSFSVNETILADAIIRVITDESLRNRYCLNAETIRERFDLTTMADKCLELIKRKA